MTNRKIQNDNRNVFTLYNREKGKKVKESFLLWSLRSFELTDRGHLVPVDLERRFTQTFSSKGFVRDYW